VRASNILSVDSVGFLCVCCISVISTSASSVKISIKLVYLYIVRLIPKNLNVICMTSWKSENVMIIFFNGNYNCLCYNIRIMVYNMLILPVLSLRAGTRYFYPATVASGTGRKNKNKKKSCAKF
jgi:hypothetical protein